MKVRAALLLLALFFLLGMPHAATTPIPAQAPSSAQASPCANLPAFGSVISQTVPWYCNNIHTALESEWIHWVPIALLVVIAAFMIATIIFAVGAALRNERVRTYGIGEYYEAIASAMIVIAFLFISAILFGLLPGIVTGPINPFSTSLSYITNITNSTQNMVEQLFFIAITDRFYTSMSITICTTTCTSNLVKPFTYAIMYFFYIPAFALIDLQMDVIMLLYAEFYLILFFMYIAIPGFLIPGVILRAFMPTRSLGGMLIAIAIGFYLVMPTLFSVAFYFTSQSTLSQANTVTNKLEEYGYGQGAVMNAITATSPLVLQLNNMKSSIGEYWLGVLFYPSLIIAMTYAVIQQIAEFIGGMSQMSGRLRV